MLNKSLLCHQNSTVYGILKSTVKENTQGIIKGSSENKYFIKSS